jgi:hypothetical protein
MVDSRIEHMLTTRDIFRTGVVLVTSVDPPTRR